MIASRDPTMLMIGLGPIIGGGANLMVGAMLKRQQNQVQRLPTDVRLTPDAKNLVQRMLAGMYGRSWSTSNMSGLPHAQHARNPGMTATARQVLPTEVFDLLNGAAEQANRVWGSLATLATAADPVLVRNGPNLALAADETMAGIFDLAEQIVRYPEATQLQSRVIRERTAQLKELADRVEASQAALGVAAPVSALDSVLDELRLSQMARRELLAEEDSQRLER
jgi:hypothetical protein